MTAADPFETGTAMDSTRPPPLAEGSRFYQRLQRRYADVFAGLPTAVPERASLTQAYAQLRSQGHDVGGALRILRQWTMAQLLTLDCEQQAPLDVITLGVTHLAEVALDAEQTDDSVKLATATSEQEREHQGRLLTLQGQQLQQVLAQLGRGQGAITLDQLSQSIIGNLGQQGWLVGERLTLMAQGEAQRARLVAVRASSPLAAVSASTFSKRARTNAPA